MTTRRFQVIIERDEDGFFIADVPALQGCHAQGGTIEEAIENIQEVIQICIDELKEEGVEIRDEFPQIIDVRTLEIAI